MPLPGQPWVYRPKPPPEMAANKLALLVPAPPPGVSAIVRERQVFRRVFGRVFSRVN